MKKKVLISLLISTFVISSSVFANTEVQEPKNKIEKTNLDGMWLFPDYDENGNCLSPKIEMPHTAEVELEKNEPILFINGSLILNAKSIIENDRTLVPLRVVSENLNANVEWEETTKKVKIINGEDEITLVIGNLVANINGESVTLDIPPKIINDYTYVPLRFIAEGLGASVNYSEGVSDDRTEYMIYGVKQVMISKYDEDVEEIGQEKALELVYEDLVYAYEKRFGIDFVPIEEEFKGFVGDEENFRYTFSHLEVIGETDRYYVIPVVFDFWVDKYTGDIYVYYNGMNKTVNKFNKDAEGALAFAG